ncbi:MAG: hypothetical protein AB7S36_19650, partial [Planctomycetota bacterium]
VLILSTHRACNDRQSARDELGAQFMRVLHAGSPAPVGRQLEMSVGQLPDGSPSAALHGVDLWGMIFRWVRGFHAALYTEFLPDRGGYIHTPFPLGHEEADGRVVFVDHPQQYLAISNVLRVSRMARCVDRVLCNAGKCRFEAVWTTDDSGTTPMCVFALRLYDWERLASPVLPRRTCIGFYFAPRPASASVEPIVRVPNRIGEWDVFDDQ